MNLQHVVKINDEVYEIAGHIPLGLNIVHPHNPSWGYDWLFFYSAGRKEPQIIYRGNRGRFTAQPVNLG